MEASVQTITPDRARGWLSLNSRNRRISKANVHKLTKAILNGEWAVNGEAIKFNCDGTLLDGQHRLEAIVAADRPIQSLVITGIESEAQGTMDLGRSRSLADFLRMDGVANVNHVASIVNLVTIVESIWIAQDNGLTGSSNGSPETVGTSRARFHAEPDRYREAVSHGAQLNHVLRWPVSALGTLSFYAQVQHPDEWAYFIESVQTGENLVAGDPALALRQAAMRRLPARGQTINRLWAFGIATKTWNAFVRDQQVFNAKFLMNGSKREQLPRVV